MPRLLCRICRYSQPMMAVVANVLTTYLHCRQGVSGAPFRVECPVFVREPGADDEWPSMRLRGRLPTRHQVIAAS
jgi:hypothetical protein